MMENIEIEITDKNLFSDILKLVVKGADGEHRIFLNDLCHYMKLDPKKVNSFIKIHYHPRNHGNPLNVRLPKIEDNREYSYIGSGNKRESTGDDIYFITIKDKESLNQILLEFIDFQNLHIQHDTIEIIKITSSVEEALRYDHYFSK